MRTPESRKCKLKWMQCGGWVQCLSAEWMSEWSQWVTRSSFSKWLLNVSTSPCLYYPDNDHSFWATVSLPNYPHPSSPFCSQKPLWSFRNKSLIVVLPSFKSNQWLPWPDDNKIIKLFDDMNSGYVSRQPPPCHVTPAYPMCAFCLAMETLLSVSWLSHILSPGTLYMLLSPCGGLSVFPY